jgi:phosphatidate cytidylyltransferase
MISSLNKYSELQQRIIAAIIGAAVIVGGVIYSQWAYYGIFLFICMATIQEFYRLLGLDGNLPLKTYGTFNAVALFTVSFLVETGLIKSRWYFMIFMSLAAIYLIKLYLKRDTNPFKNIAYTFLGIIYVGLPFALLNHAVFFDQQYHFEVILGALVILWASDSGAYFSGKTFGRRKLFERVSPKKTWEGSIGGALLALLMGFAASIIFKDYGPLQLWQWLMFSMIIVIAGTYGDLVESLFKRSINIKDSGQSIPGHGGFLDRFDGLLIASPFIAGFLELTTP